MTMNQMKVKVMTILVMNLMVKEIGGSGGRNQEVAEERREVAEEGRGERVIQMMRARVRRAMMMIVERSRRRAERRVLRPPVQRGVREREIKNRLVLAMRVEVAAVSLREVRKVRPITRQKRPRKMRLAQKC